MKGVTRRLLRPFAGDERGYGILTLALIGLLLSSMLVIPFLASVQTALLSTRSAGISLKGASCGSAGIEHVLWRLQYDTDFIGSLEYESSTSYMVPCDEGNVSVSTTLLAVPSVLPDYLLEYAFADIVLVLDVSSSVDSNEMAVFKEAAHAIVNGFNPGGNQDRYRMGITRFRGNSESRVTMTYSATGIHNGIDNVDVGRSGMSSGTNLVAGIQGGAAQFSTGLTEYYTTAGSHTFTVPEGITEITVEVWGGGGGGPTGTGRGPGGGGGAYARTTFTVSPSEQFTVNVGAGGATGEAGGDSWFDNSSTLMAKGGASPAPSDSSGAQGGQASASIGDVKYSGGNGGNRGSGGGGGGGGSAFTSANGSNGGNGGGSSGGSGGTGTGAGGAGGSTSSGAAGYGQPGNTPGGGGGGAGSNSATTSGAGAAGQVLITYGSGDRPEIPNLMVVLTDGDDSTGNTLTQIENASAASGARIFAVGIDDISAASLNAIASEPDEEHVFYVSDFQALLDIIDEIVRAVTSAGLAGSLYDIEVVGPDGTTIRIRVLITVEGEVIIVSWQEL
ncbi:MAG: VWA domain-containing protein [SAR202 cluster bacterium]|nr:VWA domain-containing protein [SAR202 cluster bacterium]